MPTPEHPWIWQLGRVIPSDVAAGREILQELLDQLESRGWPQNEVFHVHLAVHEALVNAIEHGNCCDAAKQVRVCYQLTDELLRVSISDQGAGFNLACLPDPTEPDRVEMPCGRGVLLIHAFMSRVSYNACGNEVIMEKDRGHCPAVN
jgi:serine/threonine-protein kinase RsbW